MSNTDFRSAMGCFVTGVTVVTATDQNAFVGVTANSFSSVSLDPPLVLWSISKDSQKHDIMIRAKNYVINILSRNQENIALTFSGNKKPFLGINYCLNNMGVPVISDTVAAIECELHQVYDGGDHSIILGLVTLCNKSNLKPLMFFRGKFS